MVSEQGKNRSAIALRSGFATSLATSRTRLPAVSPRPSGHDLRLGSVRSSATANSRRASPPMSETSVGALGPRLQATLSTPTAVKSPRSQCARPYSTACPTALNTLSHDVREIEATSLPLSRWSLVARDQR
jgi:hypothetical protein